MEFTDVEKILKREVLKNKNKGEKYKKPMTRKKFEEIKKQVSNTTQNKKTSFRAVGNFQGGFNIVKGSYMQSMYGCHTCPFYKNCSYYPHANGGCSDRYKFIAGFLKRWQGDSMALMEELAVHNELVAQAQLNKDMEKLGEPSIMYVALRKLANDFHFHTQKMKHGSKVKIEREVTYGDIRKKMFEKPIDAEIIKEEEENAMRESETEREEIDGKTD